MDTELHCGDALALLPTLRHLPVRLALLDPPYGIALKEHGRHGYDWTVAGDHSQDLGHAIINECRRNKWPVVAFASPRKPWTGEWRQFLVWDKGPTVGGGGDIKTCWKFTWELIQTWNTGRLNGKREQAVLKHWVTQRDYHYHPCQKPVSLLSYLIEKTTQPGDIVLDACMGSGSVGVACQQTGRRFVGIECSPEHFAVAESRLGASAVGKGVA